MGRYSTLAKSANDDCYFIGEYTARRGYAFSSTNTAVR